MLELDAYIRSVGPERGIPLVADLFELYDGGNSSSLSQRSGVFLCLSASSLLRELVGGMSGIIH